MIYQTLCIKDFIYDKVKLKIIQFNLCNENSDWMESSILTANALWNTK